MELTTNATLVDILKVLSESLQLGDRVNSFDSTTRLLEDIPELDSMAIVTLITAIESQFSFRVNDDEISAEIFESVGSLLQFVNEKLDQ